MPKPAEADFTYSFQSPEIATRVSTALAVAINAGRNHLWFRLQSPETVRANITKLHPLAERLKDSLSILGPTDKTLNNPRTGLRDIVRDTAIEQAREEDMLAAKMMGFNAARIILEQPTKQLINLARNAVGKRSRIDAKGKEQERVRTHQRAAANKTVFGSANHLAWDMGWALAWEVVSGSKPLAGKNPFLQMIAFYDLGASGLFFASVNKRPKLLVHFPIQLQNNLSGLACWVENDTELYFMHGWDRSCNRELDPVNPGQWTPKREISFKSDLI